jgi:MOSC N-terminal beta barrel domain
MATSKPAGSVVGLWRFPVKSMRGERIEQAELTSTGIVGDRAYALLETDTGKVVSAKSVRRFPDLLGCQATFVEPPRTGRDLPPVRIMLPDGLTVLSDANDCNRVLSAYFGRAVTLANSLLPIARQEQLDQLLDAQGRDELDQSGQGELAALVAECGRHVLRRAEAVSLLLARGHAVPNLLPIPAEP